VRCVGYFTIILEGAVKWVVWQSIKNTGKSVGEQRCAVDIAGEPAAKRTRELCGLNRNPLRQQQELMGSWH
jgi:hypothetical protein